MDPLRAWASLFTRRQPAPEPEPPNTVPEQLLAEINRYRASFRLPPYQLDLQLCEQDQLHSEAQAKLDQYTHFGPHGTNPLTRAYLSGHEFTAMVCENLAGDFATPIAVVHAWYCSAPHRMNMLCRHCTMAGVGLATVGSRRYWTVTFTAPPGTATVASLSGPLTRKRHRFHTCASAI